MAGVIFLLVSLVLAGACQRHGVGGFIVQFSFFYTEGNNKQTNPAVRRARTLQSDLHVRGAKRVRRPVVRVTQGVFDNMISRRFFLWRVLP